MDDKKKVEIEVSNISNSKEQAGAYALLLKEVNGTRHLPVIIGAAEAQAILITLKEIYPARPLTHILFASCLEAMGASLLRSLIYKVDNGVFYSYIYLKTGESIIRMDARTSDAVTLALRMKAPIMVYEEILESERLKTIDEEEENKDKDESNMSDVDFVFYKTQSDEEDNILQEELKEAIETENYELAAQIRDEISKRKKKKKSE